MIAIRKLKNSDLPQVSKLQVNDEQIKFVGTVDELLKETPPTSHPHVVLDGQVIIGFFNIDTIYSTRYEFTEKNEIGLRAFFIDANEQRKGYGKSASIALKPYLKENYPSNKSICLTVNCKNPAAYKCYLSGGFTDKGRLYHGGKAGPQHVLRMKFCL